MDLFWRSFRWRPTGEQAALEVGYIARTGFDRSPNYDVFPLETLLQSQNQQNSRPGGATLLKAERRTTRWISPVRSHPSAAVLAFEKARLNGRVRARGGNPFVDGRDPGFVGRRKSARIPSTSICLTRAHRRKACLKWQCPRCRTPTSKSRGCQRSLGDLFFTKWPKFGSTDGFAGSLLLDQIPTNGIICVWFRRDTTTRSHHRRGAPSGNHHSIVVATNAKLTDYQNATSALRRGNTAALAQMGQLLKVDRILFLRIQAAGPDITVFGILADGVTGETYQRLEIFLHFVPLSGEAEKLARRLVS